MLVHPGGAVTAALVDEVIAASPADQLKEITQLRQAAKAKQESPLLSAIRGGKYIAWFYDPTVTRGAELALLDALVIELQAEARNVLLPLGPANNAAGAAAVTTWSTGFAGAVDFSLGYPRSFGDEFSAAKLLTRGEVDVHLRFVDLNSQSLAENFGPTTHHRTCRRTLCRAECHHDQYRPTRHRRRRPPPPQRRRVFRSHRLAKNNATNSADVLEQIAHNLACAVTLRVR